MKIAFVMDPLEKVKAEKDTTYFIMLAAHQRGHEVYYFDQHDIYRSEGAIRADVRHVQVHEEIERPFTVGDVTSMDLGQMDVIMIRTDPPFDRNYFYTTLLLDMVPAPTRVLNRPSGLRNWNEKLAAMIWPELTPETMITQKLEHIHQFAASRERILLKPIDGFAGKGIFFLTKDDPNFDQTVDMVTHGGRHRILVQEYVPAAVEGDKRILLLNGEVMGGILRKHAEGKELNNLDAGGSAHPTELTPRDLEICKAVRQPLIDEGVFFVGIDIIGGSLIEVNVTSPTGLQQLCEFSGVPWHHKMIEAMEQGNMCS